MYTVFMYTVSVIKSFADATTEDIFHGEPSKAARRIEKQLWPVVVRKLDMLNAATNLHDLKSPGNQLEKLRGNLAGYWSVRVNDQYRIVFQFNAGDAFSVSCRDIH